MTDGTATQSHQRTLGTHRSWLILGVFALLTLGLTWPLCTVLGSRLPGTATWAFDESTFAWNIWYFKHALLDLQISPLHTELIWYPLGIDLILYTFNFLNALLALPLQLAFSLPVASNLTLLLATTLSGFGAYLLALYTLRLTFRASSGASLASATVLRLAAFLAGIVYAFASNRAIYAALGHYDMVTTQWLPFYILYLLRTLRRPGIKNPVLAAFFFALAALAEMIFASFLALASLIILLVVWRKIAEPRAALRRLVIMGGVALLLWSPVLVPIGREFLTGDYALAGWGESVKLSTDLVGLVTPTDLNPLFGPNAANGGYWAAALRLVEEGRARFSDINTVFLGYVTLGLALLGIWRGRRGVRVWIWVAVVFGILVLGPLLQINGRYHFSLDNLLPEGVTVPLPFALLHFVPFVNANRAPNRNSVILMLALAMLAGYGAAWILDRIGRSSALPAAQATNLAGHGSASDATRSTSTLVYPSVCLLAALVLAEHLALPLPTTDAVIPDIYRQIAREPDTFAVMQLPLGWRNSFGVLGSEQTQLQYFQTAHGKPILGGNISRAPAFKMEYFERIPLFRALTDLEMYRDVPPDVDTAARAQAGDLMTLYDVRYVITTPPISGRYPYQDTWQRTEAYALDVLPLERPAFWEQNGYRAYRVIQPPVPYPFRLDVGAMGAEPYMGGGWDVRSDEQPYGASANWATATRADFYLPLAGPTDATLRLAIAPLAYEGAPAQTLDISVNDVPVLGGHQLVPGWQVVETKVPAAATRRGPNRVRLDFDWAKSPRAVFPDPASRAAIGTTGVVSPVNLELHAFDEAFISIGNPDGTVTDGSAGRRGYNVTVIHPRTGRVLDMQGFDTSADSHEADALAAYLAAIPPGRIIVVATKQDATAHINDAVIAALRGMGSRVRSSADLAGQAQALVGVKGSPPGSAAEVIAPADAFLRVAGDFRTLAAAVDWVELGPQ
jgi:hypothetical protein